MTFEDFKAKHKANVLKGFDDLDGLDYWAEFKADLHTLLTDERKAVEQGQEKLYNALFQIVGIMQGSGLDKEVFEQVYKIAKENTIGSEKCEHLEIMHNAKTDRHLCADCYVLVEGRKCALCEMQ